MTYVAVWPKPPEALIGDDCPVCGARVDSVALVAQSIRPGDRDVTMPECANGHRLMPKGWLEEINGR